MITISFEPEQVDKVIETLQKLAVVQTMADIEEGVARKFKKRIAAMKEQIEADSAKRKPKRWSHKFDACIKHGGTDVKHAAKGLCANCYFKYVIAPKKAKTIIPLDVKSDGVDTKPKKT